MSIASKYYVIGNFHGYSKNSRQKFCMKQLKNGYISFDCCILLHVIIHTLMAGLKLYYKKSLIAKLFHGMSQSLFQC